MYTQAIDFDRLREERLQQEYEQKSDASFGA
jgi:hypothetical protein